MAVKNMDHFGNNVQNSLFQLSTVKWYGQTFVSDGDFDKINIWLGRTTTGDKPYTLTFHEGVGANAPVLETHNQVANATGWFFTNLTKKYPPGTYHYRVSSTATGFGVYRTSDSNAYPDGNAVADTGTGYVNSTQDLCFLVYYYVPPFIGNPNFDSYNEITVQHAWIGQVFDAPFSFNKLQFRARGNSFNDGVTVEIRSGEGANAPVKFKSSVVSLPAPANSQSDPSLWFQVAFPTLPPGKYHYRLYKTQGSGRHYYLSGAGGGASTNSRNGETSVHFAQGLYDYSFRVFKDESVPDPVGDIRKRWNGTSWVDAVVKRWNGTGWVLATISRVVFPARRYWDAEQYYPAVDSAITTSELATSATPLEDAYGVNLTMYTAAVTRSGYTTDAAPIDAPETKPSYKMFMDQLAKYPASFITSASKITQLVMAYNLRNGTTTFGGVAWDLEGEAWINITDDGSGAYSNTVFRSVEFIFHHELQHLMKYSWSTDFANMQTAWQAFNPEPYTSAAESTLPMTRPSGHIRRYGRTSYTEDLADVLAAMMTTAMQADLAQWVSEDPNLAGKVQLMNEFLASKDPAFADPHYYRAIHQSS